MSRLHAHREPPSRPVAASAITDHNNRELKNAGLARGGSINLVGAITTQGTLFLTYILLAKALGQNDVGIYSQAFALRAILQLLCMLGLRNSMTRFVAIYRADGDWGAARGAIVLGMTIATVVSVAVSAILYFASEIIARDVFRDSSPEALRLAAISLPPFVIMSIALSATQGFQTMAAFSGVGLIGEPVLRLALTVLFVVPFGWGVSGAITALTVSSYVGGGAAVIALWYYYRKLERAPITYDMRAIVSYSLVSWVSTVATQGILWADILVLSLFVSASEVGAYQIATRAVLLTTMATRPLNSSLAPKVAAQWRAGRKTAVMESQAFVAIWTWRFALMSLALATSLPADLLGVFERSYRTETAVILILAVGILWETQGSPSSVVLNMVGHNTRNMMINLASFATNVILNVILIPIMGIAGAAAAWAISLIIFETIRILQTKKLVLGRWPIDITHLYAVPAFMAAWVAGFAVNQVLDDTFAVIVAAPIVVIMYTAVLAATGLTSDERSGAMRVGKSIALRLGLRGLVARLSALRIRWATVPGDRPVSIVELISPLRYDILIRAEFIQLVRIHRSERQVDFDKFMARALETTYAKWYETVAAERVDIDAADKEALLQGFTGRVERTAKLVDSFDEIHNQIVYRSPVVLRRITGRVTTTGRTVPGYDFGPDDGCHRIALLYLDGQRYLTPTMYRAEKAVRRPVDNSRSLVRSLRLRSDHYLNYLAMPFTTERVETVQQLLALVEQQAPERMAAYLTILRDDLDIGNEITADAEPHDRQIISGFSQ